MADSPDAGHDAAVVVNAEVAAIVDLHLRAEGTLAELATVAAIARLKGRIPANSLRKLIGDKLKREKVTFPVDDQTDLSPGAGRALVPDEVMPAERPRPLGTVLSAIVRVISLRVAMAPEAAVAVALWIVAAWGCRPHGTDGGPDIFPRLVVTSATKRCGKSTLLDTVAPLVPQPIRADNISAASLFRTVAAMFPTLLLDEGDSYLHGNEEVRGLLNSGFGKAGSVLRVVEVPDGRGGRTWEPTAFPTFCPAVIAAIGRLSPTVEDRSIRIRLERKPPGRAQQRVRGADLAAMRMKVTPHLAAHADALATAMAKGVSNDVLPPGLGDRDCDNWEPLLAVAALAGGDWPQRAAAAAVALCSDGADRRDRVETLLHDIRDFSRERRQERWAAYRAWRAKGRAAGTPRPAIYDFMSSSDLLSWLTARDTSPWAECNHGRPLTPHGLTRMLKGLQIVPGRDRRGGRLHRDEVRGFWLRDFRPVWQRYL